MEKQKQYAVSDGTQTRIFHRIEYNPIQKVELGSFFFFVKTGPNTCLQAANGLIFAVEKKMPKEENQGNKIRASGLVFFSPTNCMYCMFRAVWLLLMGSMVYSYP